MQCPICQSPVEIICSGFSSDPFIDGRTYDWMCFTCSQVPKSWEFDEETNELVLYHDMDPKRLCSVKDMVDDGFEFSEAQKSIRAVKRCLQSTKVIIVSELSNNIYDRLFLADEPLKYEKA